MLFGYNKDTGKYTFGNKDNTNSLFGTVASSLEGRKEKKSLTEQRNALQKIRDIYSDNVNDIGFVALNNITDKQLDKLCESYDKLNDEQKQFIDNLNTTDAKKSLEDIDGAIGNIDTSIENANKKSRTFKTVLSGIGTTLLNMAASFAISMFVNDIVGLVSKGIKEIDKLINKSKYIQKDAKKAREEIANIKKELENTTSIIDNAKKRYAELAQEVNHLGTVVQSQGTLSTDEYKEFLDLSNQLAEVFPTLTQGYDDNGNAILNLSGDVNTIVSSLENLVEVEREAANQKIAEELPADWAGYADDVDKYEKKIQDVQNRINNIQNMLNGKAVRVSSDSGSAYHMLQEAASISGVTLPTDTKYDGYESYMVADLTSLSEEDTKKLHNALSSMINSYNNDLSRYENTIKEKTIDMYNNISTQILDGDYYNDLSDDMKKVYQGLVFNYDYRSLAKEKGEKKDYGEVQRTVEADIQNIINKVKDNPENKRKFKEYYDEIFSIDTSEGVFVENIEKIKEYIRQLAELLGVEYIDLANIFGFGDIDSDIDRVKDAFIRSDSTGKTVFDENLGYAVYDNNTEAGKAENEAYKQYEAFVDSLSKEDFDFWKTALDNGEIPQEVLHQGEAALKAYLEELQNVANNNSIEIKASDAVDSMADAKTAINSLDDLYNQVYKKEKKDGQATGYADPALLNNVESAFYKFSEKLKAEGNDAAVNELNSALEEFERIMIEQPNDAEAASKAMDDLITAYIDQTDIIKNLTEENAEWSIKQLEIMGIENAKEVVMTRLSKASKKVSEAISKLNGVLVENAKVLKESKKGSDEYIKALESIKDPLKKALSIYDKDGEATFTPEINDEFVERYLDDINKMADGDVEALDRVRQAAAKEAFLRVNVSIPTDVAEMQASQLMDIIGQVEDKNIEVGAYIDDAPFLDSLAEMMRSSDQTADAVAAAFESMGYEVEWVPRPYTVAYVKANQSNIKDTKAYQAMLDTATAKVDVPALRIKRSGSAGAGAHYVGGSSTSDSSSGGGGGGGSEPTQPKEESEETFDWIEVALQRIEEEYSRLDKVSNNVYDTWDNRNKALTDELDVLAEKYDALGTASNEYFRNAEAVQVNGGKGLNDDDYGENDELVKAHDQKLLDEAKAAWATGEYQRKVQEGQMSGDDIEKIANHFLADTIKEYQEWWNKGIEKRDEQIDVEIAFGDNYKEQFDRIKTEYDELMQYIEASANVIDEKINRTEKRGYFVSKSYYQDLKELQNKTLSEHESLYEDLIKKRDEAVDSGRIAEGSQAWHEMNEEINAVGLSIEQDKTKLVEYNNQIRQLDWDFFDWVEERISRITDEASFLVDLMSNDQLYNENGTMTDLGHATNAMYAVQYETAMRQAKDYAEERKKIEQDLAKDPANKDLIARFESLVDSEQDAIMAAEQVKNSVKSFVQEGKLLPYYPVMGII